MSFLLNLNLISATHHYNKFVFYWAWLFAGRILKVKNIRDYALNIGFLYEELVLKS
jgi:hypothetical protein